MPRKTNNRNKRRSGRGLISNSSQNYITRIWSISNPVRITQATSGTGGLTTVESGASLSNSNTMVLDPFVLGGRPAIFAAQYQQYRVLKGIIKYRPSSSSNGLVDMASGPLSAAVQYQNRDFAIGIFLDPALSSITYENVMQNGGYVGSTTRPFTLKIPKSKWLWTSTTSASPTNIDLRMTSFGKLFFAYFIASTTAIASYGELETSIVFEFKGAIDNAALLGKVIAREIARPRSIYITDIDSEMKSQMSLQDESIAKTNQTLAVENDDDFSDILETKEDYGRPNGNVGASVICPKVITEEKLVRKFSDPIGQLTSSVTKGADLSATPSLSEIIKLQQRIHNLQDVIDGMKSSSGKGLTGAF